MGLTVVGRGIGPNPGWLPLLQMMILLLCSVDAAVAAGCVQLLPHLLLTLLLVPGILTYMLPKMATTATTVH
jgi:uncharacterized membrane protein SirB2